MYRGRWILGLSLLLSPLTIFAATVDDIRAKGYMQCGVHQGLPGFSFPQADGQWAGLDVDICRAVAAAVFGSGEKVKFTPLSAKERFTALQSGEIDMLSRNTTWTFSRDVALGLNFAGITYYDGQGFMVPKSLGVKRANELDGATICTNTGTTTELNVADYFNRNNMKHSIVAFEKMSEVVAAYNTGRCDVFTTDQSGLAANRLKLSKPDDHMVLPDVISKEPLGPAVRHSDDQWLDIVRWTINGLLTAEELGVSQSNIEDMKVSKNPEILRLLGESGNLGETLGLSKDFMVHVVKAVGNYGEIFERNVGMNTRLKLPRGVNAQWNKGGLMYSPPFR